MPVFKNLKEYAQRAAGLRRPGRRRAPGLAHVRRPLIVRFKDDGLVPNHPRWSLIIYRGAVHLDERDDPAALIENLLRRMDGAISLACFRFRQFLRQR